MKALMPLVIMIKSKRRTIGSLSPSGKYKKVSEGKWVQVKKQISPIVRSRFPFHIRELRIPPAWTDVEYNSDPDAELLVKGKDKKGRTQYVYSAKHITSKASEKFTRINALNESYNSLVAENNKNLSRGMEEAVVLGLILKTGMRPGTTKDTQAEKQAYGATTLLGKHVKEEAYGTVRLEFVGKKGIDLSIPVTDQRIARELLKRKAKVGSNGRLFSTTAPQLLRYTASLDGKGFRTKDLRTHLATKIAMKTMESTPAPTNMKEYKKAVREVAKSVASRLGHTPTVSLQSYINPAVFTQWKEKL
jgi:DNA topoisomerase-1